MLRDQLRQAAQLWEQARPRRGLPLDGDGLPRVPALARALPGRADCARGGVRAGDDGARAAAAPAAEAVRRRGRAFAVLATGLAVVTVLRQQAVRARPGAPRRASSSLSARSSSRPTPPWRWPTRSRAWSWTTARRRESFALRALAAGPPATVHHADIRQTGPGEPGRLQPGRRVGGGGDRSADAPRDQPGRRIAGPPPALSRRVRDGFRRPSTPNEHLYAAKDGQVRIWTRAGVRARGDAHAWRDEHVAAQTPAPESWPTPA